MRQTCENPRRGDRSAHIMHQMNAPKLASDHLNTNTSNATNLQNRTSSMLRILRLLCLLSLCLWPAFASAQSSFPGTLPTGCTNTQVPAYQTSTGIWVCSSGGGGGGTPGGSSGDIQYNNAGSFGGFGDWNGTAFNVGGNLVIPVSNYATTDTIFATSGSGGQGSLLLHQSGSNSVKLINNYSGAASIELTSDIIEFGVRNVDSSHFGSLTLGATGDHIAYLAASDAGAPSFTVMDLGQNNGPWAKSFFNDTMSVGLAVNPVTLDSPSALHLAIADHTSSTKANLRMSNRTFGTTSGDYIGMSMNNAGGISFDTSSANDVLVIADSGAATFGSTVTTPSTFSTGAAAGTNGAVLLKGSTSGTVTLSTGAAAGTWTMKLPTSAGSSGNVLQTDGLGNTSWAAATASSITIGTTTIASGTSGRVLYDNSGVIGEMTTTGSGTVLALATAPVFPTSITMGVAAGSTGTALLKGMTSGTVTLSVADAAGTWTMKLPTSAGSNTNVLQTDGSGNTSWVASTSGCNQNCTITETAGNTALTLTGATQTTSKPALDITQTWNAGGVTFQGIKANFTNTASATTSKLLDLQIDGSTLVGVRRAGPNDAYPTFTTAGAGFEFVSSLSAGLSMQLGNSGAKLISVQNDATSGITIGSTASDKVTLNAFANSSDFKTVLAVPASNVLAQRNDINAQTFRIYNTWSDASNGEWTTFNFASNVMHIGTTKNGTGTNRVLTLDYGGTTTSAMSIPITSGTVTFGGPISTSAHVSSGTVPGISGCSAGTQIGGATVGGFSSGTTGACTVTLTFAFTAPTGWSCWANDSTTSANLYQQSGSSTTTATLTGTTVSGDVIRFGCMAY